MSKKRFHTQSKYQSPGTIITHQKRYVNASFFKSWSPAMAYVLGVICTDGNLFSSVFNDITNNLDKNTRSFFTKCWR